LNLPDYETLKYVVFLNNFFINTRLFKALKTVGIEACGTAKSGCNYSTDLLRLRAAATKNKNWGERTIITVKKDKLIEEGNILCMV
jgi:hypothetical protein